VTELASIKGIQTATGVSWLSTVTVLLMLAFILYIAGNGSLPKYKNLLF
jgi:hypothetical protein